MTVDELIAELRKHPGDLPVYMRGYEGGVDDIGCAEPVRVHRDVHPEGYYGDHELHTEESCACGDWPAHEPGLWLRYG